MWSVPPKWMHANRENLISWYLSIKEVDTVPYRTVLAGTAGILRTSTETPSKCTAQDTGLYQTIPAVPEYTWRFSWKREIWPVQKLKGKIEEMHDLNKTQCIKFPPHWHRRLDLLLPFFFFFFFSSVVLLHCSDFFSFFAEQWTLLCGISFFVLCYLKFLKPFHTWLALEMLKTYIFLIKDGLNGSAFYLLFSF